MYQRQRHVRDEIREEEGPPEDHLDIGERTSFSEHSMFYDWSPAQFLGWIVGVFFVVLGAVALARLAATGQFHTSVAGLHQTPWLAVAHVGVGLLLLMAGAMAGGMRGLMSFLGTLTLTFGIIVLVEPRALHGGLGVHTAHGVLYVIVGIACLAASVFSPSFRGGQRGVSRSRHATLHR